MFEFNKSTFCDRTYYFFEFFNLVGIQLGVNKPDGLEFYFEIYGRYDDDDHRLFSISIDFGG